MATFGAEAGDGYVSNSETSGDSSDWDVCHDATSGDSSDYTTYGAIAYVKRTFTPPFDWGSQIIRGFVPFDTSAIGSSSTIDSASCALVTTWTYSSQTTVRLVQADQPSSTEISNADFNNCGATDNPTKLGNDQTVTPTPQFQSKIWEFNNDGISAINKSGSTKIGTREVLYDAVDNDPLTALASGAIFGKSESATEWHRPVLTVNYTTLDSPTKMLINVNDDWKEIAAMKINVGDAWKTISGANINVGDAWKEIF